VGVRHKLLLGIGWALATIMSGSIAWAAVGTVRDAVTDRPSDLVSDAVVQAAGAVTSIPTTEHLIATTGAKDTSSTVQLAGSVTTVTTAAPEHETTVPTTTDAGSPTTPQPSEPTTTTTTTVSPGSEWKTKTYSLDGGTVSIKYRSGEVLLKGAIPEPGFRVDVKSDGPDEVEVQFEGGDDDNTEFHAYWRNGELVVRVAHDD
jgi:hypothetical protein